MPTEEKERVAIIGAGVSGIAAANVWQRCGYSVTIFEASGRVGGQWTKTYPGVTLQNTSPQYQFGDFSWPFEPDRHPTGAQVLEYLEAAAAAFDLEIKLNHRITRMARGAEGGWVVTANGKEEQFSYVVVAAGEYPGGAGKLVPNFEGLDTFKGEIVTNIDSHDVFKDKRVAVVGFGKTALDFASWSAPLADETVHVFRTPRWTIPDWLLGIDFSRPFFARFGSDMMPSWCHSSAPQRALHKYMGGVVRIFWFFIATLFQFQHRRDAKLGKVDKDVLADVFPPKSRFTADLRSATALAPARYYEQVAHGQITAVRGEVASFCEGGLLLSNGKKVEADLVCLCCGNAAPTYSYLPERERGLLEGQKGGPALYRHLIHPQIPELGFAGYNHGFLHIALCEMGSLWTVAAHRGDLKLPSEAEMLESAERVAAWKSEHSAFEATGNMSVNTRSQQHLDILLQDLGISQWRKFPNLLAEFFARYDPTDYCGVVEEYLEKSEQRRAEGTIRPVMPVDV